ncbi:hypothetical protein [Halogeometricum luteum]|uniref:DUF3955 domain-containing protein n=1 Tax=Halogeometricum luteum TaxID=2950537 RepID=A0ABU2G2I9_9EURY|nr:hypothetical protein [Halogeometricum sp. S3BR5-2]MDS0295002.1 hypothetical protein [Halogeometricum sp. S3BR5-2]
MPDDPAADSLRYALRPELLKLYGVTVFGYLVTANVRGAFGGFVTAQPWQGLLELPFVLLGLALFFGGFVGVLHRVLSDASSNRRRSRL